MSDKKFYMGFWNYTPTGALDEAQAAQDWKDLGMNLAMSSAFARGDDKARLLKQLDEAHRNGIKVIVCDERLCWKNLENGEQQYIADVESATADFGGHPAFFAFSVGDEPSRKELENAITAARIVNRRSKAFLNFLPMADQPFVSDYRLKDKYHYEDVLADAAARAELSELSYDNYTQCNIHNRSYGLDQYFDNLRIYRNAALRCGIDFWTTLLSVGHWYYRTPTEDDIRWQLSTAAAHGAKGILWFFIYTREQVEDNYRNAPFDCFYQKTRMFEYLSRQNKIFIKYYADRFASATLKNVYHYNTAYGGFPVYKDGDIEGLSFRSKYGNNYIISEFTSEQGDFLAVVNNMQGENDSDNAHGIWKGKPFSAWLAPGQLCILENQEQ